MPAGQPTKYRDEFATQVVQFCAQGFSLTAFAGSIGVARDTITEWQDVHSEFSAACKRAKSGSVLWWERKAQKLASRGGSGGQTAMCIFMLKNHAPEEFRERVELTGKDGGALALELLLSRLDEPKTIEHEPQAQQPAIPDKREE